MTRLKDIRQLTFGPRITLSPCRVGLPGMYICSAATRRALALTACAVQRRPIRATRTQPTVTKLVPGQFSRADDTGLALSAL